METFDVAIVGCGPVGAALATLLGGGGHRVLVLERHEAAYPLPRAVHYDHEVARILQACGLGEDLPSLSEPAPDYVWRNAAGEVLLHFGGRPLGPSGWPDTNMFWQPALEALLEASVRNRPTVELRRGAELVHLSEDGEGPARLSYASGGEQVDVEARYVIGADGANSTVRTLLETKVTDLGFFYDWLIVDVVLSEPRVFDPVNLQVCDPRRPTTAVSGGPGRRRWEFMRLPDETIEELDDSVKAWELLAAWDVTPQNATLERHAVYRFHARWAETWRVGNVLLAGDAAHQMPPFAGQGMCSGLRDAVNLAWKLDLVLRGSATDALLDTYQRERVDNVRALIDFSMALGKVICVTDPEEAVGRDAFLLAGGSSGPQIPPPLPGIGAGLLAPQDPLAGQLFVQGQVVGADGRVRRFDDEFGAGWRLLVTDAVDGELPPDLRDWFDSIGGVLVAIDADHDVDGTYDRWFAERDVVSALQRPDFHLFGVAATAEATTTLLASLRTALASPTTFGADR